MKANILAGVLGSALVIAAFGWAGDQDYEVEKREAIIYSEMVCAGAWGDYDNRKTDCSEGKRVAM